MTDVDRGPWTLRTAPTDGGAAPKRTSRERATEILRNRILSGDLSPGDRIDLDAVADEFGTSRTPVREACLALAQEGLVRVAQRSGVSVIGVSPETIIENFAFM